MINNIIIAGTALIGHDKMLPKHPKENIVLVERQIMTIRSLPRLGIEKLSMLNYYDESDGVPPKQWGEYLQRTGKQKWVKKYRKR